MEMEETKMVFVRICFSVIDCKLENMQAVTPTTFLVPNINTGFHLEVSACDN